MLRMNALRVYYILSAALTLGSSIMFTTLTVYYITVVGMNPLQLVLVGTVLECTILIFEVPTGVIADLRSRRLSVTLGMFVLGVGWLLEGSVPLFGAILVAEVIRGIGETLLSGALDAWLADEVGEERVGQVYLRSGQINRVVGIIGIGISVGLASIALQLPVLVGGGLFLATGLFLVWAMPERNFTPTPRGDRTTWQSMGDTFRAGLGVVRRSQTLTLLLVVGVFAGIASEGFDRLWEAHLLTNFRFPQIGSLEPVVWFGVINIAFTLVTLLVTELLRQRLERISALPAATVRALFVLNGLRVLSIVGFGLAGNFPLACAALVCNAIFGSLAYPLYRSWLVQNIDSRVRATALSMIGQTDALGQTLGGPAIGALGVVSLRGAMVAAGLLLSPAMLLYARVMRQEDKEKAAAQALS